MSAGATHAVALLEQWGVPSRLASNAGLAGAQRGYITDLARDWLTALTDVERREVQVARFAANDYKSKVQPTDAELQAYYKAHEAQYQAPEQADIQYVVLDLASVATGVKVDEADLKKRIASDPNNAQPRLELGNVLATKGKYKEALEALLSAAELDRELGRGPVRELMVKVFEIVGVRSELADEYRDKLRAMLY